MSKAQAPNYDRQTELKLAGEKILQALSGIRYGAVEVIIHDGRIVQIERKEKLRLELPGSAA